MNCKIIFKTLLVCALSAPNILFAGDANDHTAWQAVKIKANLSEKWATELRIEQRQKNNIEDLERRLIESSFSHKSTNYFNTAIGYRLTSFEQDNDPDILSHRLFSDFILFKKYRTVKFDARSRFLSEISEADYNTHDRDLYSFYRQRFGIRYTPESIPFKLYTETEIFTEITSTQDERVHKNRYTIGSAYLPKHHYYSLETFYSYEQSRISNDKNIWGINLYLYIPTKN